MKCTTCETRCADCTVFLEWLGRWDAMSEGERIQELDRLAGEASA